MNGQIFRIIAGFYDVVANGKDYRVRCSNNLRNTNQTPLVGDFVDFEANGVIKKISERKNFLIRPKVANVDQVVVVVSLVEPDFSVFLLMKILAVFESRNVSPILVFTKKDKASFSLKDDWIRQGYPVFEIANNLQYVETIKKLLIGKLTVFTGQTGVGKTTLINNLTGLTRTTGEISRTLNRGKHTTRVVEILDFDGMRLIDTPGFSSFDLDLNKIELAHSYHDFRFLSTTCKYRSCIHFNEKESDCAVKQAVRNGKITETRYNSYTHLLKEIEHG